MQAGPNMKLNKYEIENVKSYSTVGSIASGFDSSAAAMIIMINKL
jgi:hypothetical protein